MYDLKTSGVSDLGRSTLFRSRAVKRDRLSGLVDGSNAVFHTTYYPMLSSGSCIVYSSGSVVSSEGYEVDYETGAIVFNNAPAVQPEADYTYSQLTTEQFVDILMAGFDEMEGRWTRGWYLSSNGTTYAVATRDDDHIYIVSKAADGTVSDPVCGTVGFSASRTQIRFFIACCEYVLLRNRADDSAGSMYTFREGMGGLTIDKSDIPRNLEQALERKEKELAKLLQVVWEQADEELGGYVPPVCTEEYEAVYGWQGESRDEDRTTS